MRKYRWGSGLAIAIVICGLGCGYGAGSYRFFGHGFKGTRFAGQCLDLAVSSHPLGRAYAPMVTYALGNRCDDDAPLDLRRARVWAQAVDGSRIPLVPRDPRSELREAALAAAWVAWVSVEYAFDPPPPLLPALREICVDLTGVAVGVSGVVCLDPEAS